uniref:Uncharacterized protein n=1 Tax=viral metagenome TaxID=1070528 RepID=A0A6C0HRS5_9ZZZZ
MEKTRKKRTRGGEPLKSRLLKQIGEKDICCEENVNRDVIIELIIENYKKIADFYNYENKEEYLNFIDNDLVGFIGYKVDLDKTDPVGKNLWDDVSIELGDKQVELIKVKNVLKEVPLSFLLAFLGYATYKEKQMSSIEEFPLEQETSFEKYLAMYQPNWMKFL